MADNYGVGALGGVVLVDPDTGLPYKATGGSGGGAVDSVNGQTGTVVLDADDIGLGNVTNDAQLKASDLDTDPDLTANSDAKVPSQKAVKAYVDANSGGGGGAVDSVNGQTGTVVLNAADVGARADDWTPAAADISDATTVGRDVLTAVDAATARSATGVGDATSSARGLVELATTGEATTGTDTQRAVTPAGLKAGLDARVGGGLVLTGYGPTPPDPSGLPDGRVWFLTEV